jgi:hypothetical protein
MFHIARGRAQESLLGLGGCVAAEISFGEVGVLEASPVVTFPVLDSVKRSNTVEPANSILLTTRTGYSLFASIALVFYGSLRAVKVLLVPALHLDCARSANGFGF